MDKYGYIGIETLLNYCENSKDHAVTPNEFMRMKRVRMAEPPWIPCSKELPEEDGDYWVTVDPRHVPPRYRSTDMITWRDGKWVMADYFVLDGEGLKKPEYKVMEFPLPIIAWMPLPEPYAERRTDDG